MTDLQPNPIKTDSSNGFAHGTFTDRLPQMLRSLQATNDFSDLGVYIAGISRTGCSPRDVSLTRARGPAARVEAVWPVVGSLARVDHRPAFLILKNVAFSRGVDLPRLLKWRIEFWTPP